MATKPEPKQGKTVREPVDISRGRLEILFDGVFAIAMTLLVLDLKVPELSDRHSVKELMGELGRHGSTLFSYLFSFVILGVLWFKHQRQYRHIRRVGLGGLVANLLLMATAAFFPFCAALFGRYPTNIGSQLLYTACIFVHMIASDVQWRLAARGNDLAPDLPPAVATRIRRENLRAVIILGVLTASLLVQAGIRG